MAHEHQRMDRDKYMSYHCENLADFDEKYKKAKEDDRMYSSLCHRCLNSNSNSN